MSFLNFAANPVRRFFSAICSYFVKFYSIILLLFFVVVRSPSIVNMASFNPDEAELLAQGRRAALDLVPYRSFTSATYGAVWPFFLGLLRKLSIPLTIPIAHLLSALFGALICIIFYKGISRNLNSSFAIAITSPLALMWATGFGDADFLSLATELLPCLIYVTGAYLAFCKGIKDRDFYVASILIGTAAWTKYNFAPLVFVTLALIVFLLIKRKKTVFKAFALVAVFSNVYLILLFSSCILFSVPNSLLSETWRTTIYYIRNGGIATGAAPTLSQRLSLSVTNILGLFPVFIIFTVALIFLALSIKSSTSRKNFSSFLLITSPLLVFITGVGSLLVMWPVFPHYNHLLIISSISMIFIASKNLDDDLMLKFISVELRGLRNYFSSIFISFCVLLSLPTLNLGASTVSALSKAGKAETYSSIWDRTRNDKSASLSDLCPSNSVVFVWGWSSELYSYYDWIPASRYVNSLALMQPNPLSSNPSRFRRVFRAEFLRTKPTCVVDATGPSFFPGYSSTFSLAEQMPSFVKSVKKTYQERIVYWDGVNPVQVFVRNDQ
jgi:hypothetical protein